MRSFHFSAPGFEGYDSTSGVETLPPRVNESELARLSVAKNVRFTRKGGVSRRLGSRKEATLSTSLKVDSIETQPKYNVMFAKSGTSIVQSVDGVTWYDIGVTRTAAARDFLFPNGKDMYATNITDSYLRIACSTIAADIAAAATTITIRTGDIAQFAAGGGTVYINGTAYTYTGTNSGASTLTGVLEGGVAVSTTQSSGAIITEGTNPASGVKGACIAEFLDRILVGGVTSANATTMYYSDTFTDANPEKAYDFSGGTAGTKPLPSDITAIKAGEDVVVIGMKQGLARATDFVSGALVTKVMHKHHGVPNAFCIAQMDKNFAVLTNEGRVLEIGLSDAGFTILEDPEKPKTALDYPIQGYIRENADSDQSLAFLHGDPVRKELTATIIINGISEEFVYQWDRRMWCHDTGKNFACRANFKNRVYGGADDTSAEIYLDNEGVTDDTIPFTSHIVTGKLRLSSQGVTGDFLRAVFGGLLNDVGELKFRIYVDGVQINTGKEDVTADDLITKKLMQTGSGVPIGGGQIGAEQIGSGGSPIEAYPFEYPLEIMDEGEFAQLEWEIDDEGTVFDLRHFSLSGEHESSLLLTPA